MAKNLTGKQENFCQAYLKLGDMSAAFRQAYNAGNMKSTSVNRKAFTVFNEPKISARIVQLQEDLAKRNRIDIDELVVCLANMVRFDISEFYDENGCLKNVHDMSLTARQMISHIESQEAYNSKGEFIGTTKKIRNISKLDAIEKLMKHLGAYEKDNKQKTPVLNFASPEERDNRIADLMGKVNKK